MKNLLVVRVTEDIRDITVSEIYAHSKHYGIETTLKDISSIIELQTALKTSVKYDYIYFAGHGDETCFTDNKVFNSSWSEIGKIICQADCLTKGAIIMLYCCKGGINTVAFQLMAECPKIEYICGAKQNVASIDLIIGFNVFMYNVEKRQIDPVLSADKATAATEIRFECFDRVDVEANPLYYYKYCKECQQNTFVTPITIDTPLIEPVLL